MVLPPVVEVVEANAVIAAFAAMAIWEPRIVVVAYGVVALAMVTTEAVVVPPPNRKPPETRVLVAEGDLIAQTVVEAASGDIALKQRCTPLWLSHANWLSAPGVAPTGGVVCVCGADGWV